MKSEPTGASDRGWGRRLAVLLAVFALLLAACGDDDDAAADAGENSGDSGDTDGDAGDETGNEDEGGSLLGEPNPASGDPVMVGWISDGRTASVDNTSDTETAEAIVEYLNEYRGGIAGRPIELVVCETAGEPGKATQCANELVQEGIVLNLMPETIVPGPSHSVLSDNGIATFVYAVTDPAILTDPENAFQLADAGAGLTKLPIDVAETNDIGKVTVVGFDIPAVSGYFDTVGGAAFEAAGLDFEYIPVPPGQADITGQMIEVANGDPTVVHIVGDEALCIATISGLDAAGFDGPVSGLVDCVSEAVKEAVGEAIEGFVLGSPSPIGAEDDPDIKLFNAILDEYSPDTERQALNTFITVMSAHLALEDIPEDITPDTIKETIRAAPLQPIPGGGGLEFRCDGSAAPATPAVCTRGTNRVVMDADGDPRLPYEVAGGWDGEEG